jgi:hypothetical protein
MGVLGDQMGQQAGGEHGVANSVGRDKQDPHFILLMLKYVDYDP